MKKIMNRSVRRDFNFAWLASCVALAGAGSAAAQNAPDVNATASSSPGETPSGLPTIVVTARKRTESAQDVPVSITAFSAEQLAHEDLTSLERLAVTTPQFSVGRAPFGSGAQLTLRGIGSNSNAIGIEQSVAVVVDGVYYGQGRIIDEGFFDLAGLEILKGPQALYYGKNATAGVISNSTADPTTTPLYTVKTGYEFNAENLYGEAVASGPVSDTVGYRVAVRASNMFGGYFHNSAVTTDYPSFDVATGQSHSYIAEPSARNSPGEQDFIGRVTLTWDPSAALKSTLKLSGNSNSVDNAAFNSVLYACPNGFNQAKPTNACGRNFQTYQLDPPEGVTYPYALSDNEDYDHYRSYSASETLVYHLENVGFTSVTNFNSNLNQSAFDSSYADVPSFIPVFEDTTYHAFSTELRALTTFDAPVNYLAGVYYESTKRVYDQAVALGNVQDSAQSPNNLILSSSKNSQTKGSTISGYGQLIWKVVPQVELTGGVRFIHETKDSYFLQPYVNPALVAIFTPNKSLSADQVFHDWSPDFTATYKPTRDITLYAAYKEAYKSGGFANDGILGPKATVSDFAFNPEKAKGYEVGVKTTLEDNQLRLNFGAYNYKFSNLQLDYFDAVNIALIATNAGFATTKGVELESQFVPRAVEGLDLHATLNYNKARYGDFIAPCWGGQSIAAGCDLEFSTAGQVYTKQNLSGAPTSVAPDVTASMGTDYDRPVTARMLVDVSADVRYSGSYLVSPFGTPSSRNPSYVVLDAGLRAHTKDGRYEAAVIGKNLTNRFYVTGGIDSTNTGSGTGTAHAVPADQIGFVGIPRTVQMEFSARF